MYFSISSLLAIEILGFCTKLSMCVLYRDLTVCYTWYIYQLQYVFQYLQCVSNWDTAILHQAINICVILRPDCVLHLIWYLSTKICISLSPVFAVLHQTINMHVIMWHDCILYLVCMVFTTSQWAMTLQCNIVSHWLGAFEKWSQGMDRVLVIKYMGQVIELWLSCYLVLLSIDSKTR